MCVTLARILKSRVNTPGGHGQNLETAGALQQNRGHDRSGHA